MVSLTASRPPLRRRGRMRILGEHPVPGADPTPGVTPDPTEPVVPVAAGPREDLEVPRPSVAVAHVLRAGRHPIPDGARRPGPTITMSGAGVA